MERRVFLAVILCMVVLYAYQALVPTPPSPSNPPSTPAATTTPAPQASAPAAAIAEPVATSDALVSEPAEREIVVETADVQAVLTNRGGRVLHWRLKKYLDGDRQPVDLVPSDVPASEPRPFSLTVDDPQITARLNGALYRVTGDAGGRLDVAGTAQTLVFEFQDASGLRVRKAFAFDPDHYVVTFSADVTRGSESLRPTVTWGPGLGDVGAVSGGGSFFTGNYVQPPQAIFQRGGEVERWSTGDLADQTTHEGEFRFTGIDDHYFLATAINAPGNTRTEFRPLSLPGAADTQRQLVTASFRFANIRDGVKFFIGPKHFETLQAVDGDLVRAIHFGIFAWLAVPLLNGLNWLHGYIGNYGWSIIALTIIINLVLFPLRHKSAVAMRKMQVIQPRVKAIQDRYAHLSMTDPAKQKMNTEIMNLYREAGANPASGCVPMLLQFPVLIAMYSVFSQAIELRGADFGLWIHDLSQHDPYYVTPLLMGATMFWQQKMMPTTADPAQQRVMMIMPVMMTAIFLRLASGLAIYYLIGNLWTIGQQYFTNRLLGTPPAPRPPAERRVKTAGAGRTAGADKKHDSKS